MSQGKSFYWSMNHTRGVHPISLQVHEGSILEVQDEYPRPSDGAYIRCVLRGTNWNQ